MENDIAPMTLLEMWRNSLFCLTLNPPDPQN